MILPAMTMSAGRTLASVLDLALPRECGGCDRPGTSWCAACESDLTGPPVELRPRVDPGVGCWALGPYTGCRRGAVIALKERGRHDLAGPLGNALATAVKRLRLLGHIDPPELADLVLVPAPTRARAARSRGGDPVARCARNLVRFLEPERVVVAPVLRMRRGVADSVGLGASERARNIAGRVSVVSPRVHRRDNGPSVRLSSRDRCVVLVDDVLTTGATVSESVSALTAFGVRVDAVLVVASV